MLPIDFNTRTIGVNFLKDNNAAVLLWAPGFEQIEIIIKGKETLSLQKEEFGYWYLQTDIIQRGDLYRFRLNGGKSFPDPASVSQPEDVHGHSEAINLHGFKWCDDKWKNFPLEEYIIYELHTGTFTDEGSFEAIERKLEHLLKLGITAIEIMPVAQFPGTRNWGYDGVYPFAVQHSYGGVEGLQYLVNACHQKGIAVILDVVYNHLGPEGNYLAQFGKYFTDKYCTPWGQALNFDDEWCDEVRRYFIENVLMWFRDFHIDALRMDAVQTIKDFSPVHILREIKEQVNTLMQNTSKQHYLFIECDLNDSRYINPLEQQGFGIDATWSDEFHHTLRVAAGQEQTGYFSDFNGVQHLAKAYKDSWVYDGIYSPHRLKTFGTKTETEEGKKFVVFSQNHDQIGNRMMGERTSELVSFEMQKLLAATVILSPYLPLLFMGEEYCEANPFLYFVSHTDPALIDAVRKGRKAEFAAFHAEGEAPDPEADETFLRSKLNWSLLNETPHKLLLQYYKELIALRKNHPVLKQLNRANVNATAHEEKQTVILHRWNEKQSVFCLMNFSKEVREVDVPIKFSLQKLFDSALERWNGKPQGKDKVGINEHIKISAESVLVYYSDYV